MGTIARKLDELRAADPDLRIFGAGRHRYEARPPVESAVLDRVETIAGVELPEVYRSFVTTIGDGAPGPYYGIHPLGRSMEFVEESLGAEMLGRDSPLSGDVDFVELLGGPAEWTEHAERLERDSSYAAGFERLQGEYLDEPWCHGRLPIADLGCGSFVFLVLRGARRGTVWVDSLSDATGLYCLEVGFATWYCRWLDDALDRAARQDFGPVTAHYSDLRFGDNPRYRPVAPDA
jgi:hypothetical protein